MHRATKGGAGTAGRLTAENVNVAGYKTTVDAAKYRIMHWAVLGVLPTRDPGLKQAEMYGAVVAHLHEDPFPGGANAGWWAKAVQLDQETKAAFVREPGNPPRWHRARRG